MSVLKKLYALIAVLTLLAVMTACGGDAGTDGTPEPEATEAPAATTPASTVVANVVTPSPSPTVTPEPSPPPIDVDVTLTGGFKALAKESDIVVLGTFKKVNGIINMAPDPKNGLKVDTTVQPSDYKNPGTRAYVGEYQFEFVIDTVYKGSKLKKDDKLTVQLPYEFQMKDKPLFKEELFVMPELDKPVVMFLSQDKDYKHYYPNVEPHKFNVVNDTLYIVTADKTVEASWEKGAGVTGIPMSAFKKELGVK